MIFGDLVGLKFPYICLTGEEKPRKNLTQETCPDRGSNPGPLRDKRACYHLLHSAGQIKAQNRILSIFTIDEIIKAGGVSQYLLYGHKLIHRPFFVFKV